MSDQKIEALEIGLYEDYLDELQKKYYGGINKVLELEKRNERSSN